jgi:hypothetical protein
MRNHKAVGGDNPNPPPKKPAKYGGKKKGGK